MPNSTAYVSVMVVKILSFSYSNNNFAQLGVPDLLVYMYMVSSKVTFHSRDASLSLLSFALVVATHCGRNLLYLPIDDSLQ